MRSPFDVLLVDADADEDEVEQAYRERVMEVHPDQGGSVEEFQAVRTAYERLKAGYRENGDGTAPDSTDPDARPRERDQTVLSRVTYLNYDVLGDFGWETDDADLFQKAAAADLDEEDYGEFDVHPGQSLLEAAEDNDFAWPFACRGGACANCAIMLLDGELSMPASHVLPVEMMERGIRLSCNGIPITRELSVVYNVKHMPDLDDLLLPPTPFDRAYSDD